MAAIGTESKQRLGPARNAFPERVDHGVYYCGYAAESSYGARSYLIRWMFLTHRDDVADHAKFRERFGCERILHAADVTRGTAEVERKLKGEETTSLDEEALFIPVPGHTPGSTALLYRDRFLFSGDHGKADGVDAAAARLSLRVVAAGTRHALPAARKTNGRRSGGHREAHEGDLKGD